VALIPAVEALILAAEALNLAVLVAQLYHFSSSFTLFPADATFIDGSYCLLPVAVTFFQ
jgi:hypothetical protein